ncbi:MAG: carbohydrate kinase [Eubacteriales bacterium]|nr:carbohydrate kinase [Eubacteriales bacterium]
MFDVVAIGELLIDFTPNGKGEMGNPAYEMNPGGAPANCLAALATLGADAAFIGKVGDDFFGKFLSQALNNREINTEGLSISKETNTTLAFVHLEDNGERHFSFLRGADVLLKKEDIETDLLDSTKIFHYGSVSLTNTPSRETVLDMAQYAKKIGKTVSYDPNYRELLWINESEAIKWMKKGLEYADLVKMSEEELKLITTYNTVEEGAKSILITLGERGTFFMSKEQSGYVDSYKVKSVDTTGCGDAFMGAFLFMYNRRKDAPLSEKIRFANAAGALCATKKGGIPAMPSLTEINWKMKNK